MIEKNHWKIDWEDSLRRIIEENEGRMIKKKGEFYKRATLDKILNRLLKK